MLDATRITPELYTLTEKMFSAALNDTKVSGNLKKMAKIALSKKRLFETFDWNAFKQSLRAREESVSYLGEEGVDEKVDLIVREVINPYSVSEFRGIHLFFSILLFLFLRFYEFFVFFNFYLFSFFACVFVFLPIFRISKI